MPKRRLDGTISGKPENVRIVAATLRRMDAASRPYPTLRELADFTGLSTTAVYQAVCTLVERGDVTHHSGYGLTPKGRS